MTITYRIGDFHFMSRDKECSIVHVREGINNVIAMPRAEAEQLYRKLVAQGFVGKELTQLMENENGGMGNLITGQHWR